MKIMFLNIFEGCQEPERFGKIVSFINRENPEILGLSELYDWDKDNFTKLKKFLDQTDFNSHVFYKSANNFHVGIFLKHSFGQAADISEGLGMAKAKVTIALDNLELSVIVAHLSARDEDTRLKEFEIIAKNVSREEPTIFMGDFNSLSPLDPYDDSQLLDDMRKAGMDKFGGGELRKEVIQKIMDAGFIDAVRKRSQAFEYSVPTGYCRDPNHFTKLRLDYLFITESLRSSLRDARILRTEETNQLSDHFPLLAEFTV
ncbi:endonuclease/exonuclease/phosphatase family protein [Candidatus Uhrbacteria bacterium]|nr:endonuclease/exonuclease/phosphatase family protein [Candidatus Uhrbacteria bacterium]